MRSNRTYLYEIMEKKELLQHLYVDKHMSLQQIAEKLHMPVGRVKSLIILNRITRPHNPNAMTKEEFVARMMKDHHLV